jgi:hypothetical protein
MQLLSVILLLIEFDGEERVETVDVEDVGKVPPGEEQRLGDEKETSSGVNEDEEELMLLSDERL